MGGAIVPSLSGASIASPCIHTVCSRPRPCRRGCLETPKATAGILHGPGSRGALSMRSLPARLPLSCRAYKRGARMRSVASEATGEPKTIEAERSDMVNEQLLLFIFQMELDKQLQRALNMDAFEVAKQIRERRAEIDAAVVEFEETKYSRSGTASTSSTDIRDTVSEGLLLRSELQRAIEEEDYASAARIRDQLSVLEEGASELQATLEAERWDRAQPLFEIGQRFVHATKGYRGVIVGWDRTCCEDDEWRERAQVNRLSRRDNQPFYHVLVDQNHSRWESSDGRAPVAYVAEEMIKVPKGQSWAEAYGDGEVAHPYYYLLFFGKDSQGGCIPIAQLREQYGQDRRDVYADDDGYDSDDDWDDGDEPKSPEKDPDGP